MDGWMEDGWMDGWMAQDCVKIAVFNKYELYYSHFINCPGLLKCVFEEPDHSSIINEGRDLLQVRRTGRKF